MLIYGMVALTEWLYERPLRAHGQVTACTVRTVKEHAFVWNTGESVEVINRYENTLTCDEPRVTQMGTTDRVAEPGDRITVAYDLTSRTPPRLAGELGGLRASWQAGAALYGLGMLMRILGAFARPTDA